ncbi:STAS domain-containing protein [Amycolatopsis sp. NPDC089917]|uniref:STAS domain-containing protein n=1 Tax=Amycolatopsis sp. NPDC089917 TaxID=3155187 RepID=UPI003436DBC5
MTSTHHTDGRSAAVLTTPGPGGLGFYARPLEARPTGVWHHTVTTDLLILAVSGELDMRTASLLRQNLSQPLPAATVFDLSQLTFLGAAGLEVLQAEASRAVTERRRIGLVTDSAAVLRILRLFDLDVRVPVYPLMKTAVRELTRTEGPDSFS